MARSSVVDVGEHWLRLDGGGDLGEEAARQRPGREPVHGPA